MYAPTSKPTVKNKTTLCISFYVPMTKPICCFHNNICTGCLLPNIHMILALLHAFLPYLYLYEDKLPSKVTGHIIELCT